MERDQQQPSPASIAAAAVDDNVRENIEDARSAMHARLTLATRAACVGVWDYTVHDNRLEWDDQMYALYGVTKDQFDGVYEAWKSGIHPEDRGRGDEEIQLALRGEKEFDTEFRVIWPDKSIHFIRAIAIVKRDASGQPVRMIGTNWDITPLKKAQEQALEAEQFLRSTIDSLESHTVVVGRDGRVVSVNQAWREFAMANSGLGRDVLEGADYLAVCDRAAPRSEEAGPVAAAIRTALAGGDEAFSIEYPCHAPNERRWFMCTIRGFSCGKERYAVVSHLNITGRKKAEQELEAAARLDKLTGLPNRGLISDRIQQAILRAKRLKSYHFAVLFLDFDRFKSINDSLGHGVGDMLLREISRRLQTAIRASDSSGAKANGNTAGRLGGDEFVILLDGLDHPLGGTAVAERLLVALAQPYQLGEHTVHSTASIGIYTSDIPADTADDVLCGADTAMYEAKLAGKARYVVFDVSMRQRIQNRLNMENDLRGALEAGELFLMYQPIISLQTGELESLETLIRWKHPVRGLISPGEFIPLAEETGLIIPIGQWVLREACAQFVGWQSSMESAAPRTLSVNLSRIQLGVQGLPAIIKKALTDSGMDPACLHLEITESAMMKDVATGIQMLNAIKETGVKLDMDDFGTGYSSLSSLHQFPIDVLKIDRSFVANIGRGRDFAALVQAVVQLARNLNIRVVAEGIETAEQALILQSLECEFGQGYFFSKPLTAEQTLQFRSRPVQLPGEQERSLRIAG